MVLRKKQNTQKRVIVHLGNRGLDFKKEPRFEKTFTFARRFKNFLFKGIDIRHGKSSLSNWEQQTGDALKKLREMKNSSINMISSDMFVGYYDNMTLKKTKIVNSRESKSYSEQLFSVALKKLKPKGTFFVTIDNENAGFVIAAAKKAGFKKENITFKEIKRQLERGNSYWTRSWESNSDRKMFKIRFQK